MRQFLLLLIKRFLNSNRKSGLVSSVSKITIGGIAIGITVVILALTILDGFESVISDKINEFNAQIKITGFGNRNLPASEYIAKKVTEDFKKDISSVDPFASKLAIIKSPKVTDGITLTGVSTQFASNSFNKFLVDGTIFSSEPTDKEVLIGKNLAQKMGILKGDRITIFCLRGNAPPSLENPPAIEQFSVTGISEYDDWNAFINLKSAQELFGMSDEVSGFNISINYPLKLSVISSRLQDYLGYPFYVRSIYQVHQNIFTWIELQKKPIPIVLGLIIIVAVFNIIGSLLMIVLEKTNAIGILKSLGAMNRHISRIFVYQGIFLAMIGIILGNILAYSLMSLQLRYNIISLPSSVYFTSTVPIILTSKIFIGVSLITLILCLTASFIPSYIASRVKPLSSLRFS